MTMRAVSIVLLAITGLIVAAIVLAGGVSAARWLGWSAGMWVAPATLFASTTFMFFLGRHHILPPHLVTTSGRALVVVTAWNGLALVVTATAIFLGRRAGDIAGIGALAILTIWLFSVVAIGSLLTQRLHRASPD